MRRETLPKLKGIILVLEFIFVGMLAAWQPLFHFVFNFNNLLAVIAFGANLVVVLILGVIRLRTFRVRNCSYIIITAIASIAFILLTLVWEGSQWMGIGIIVGTFLESLFHRRREYATRYAGIAYARRRRRRRIVVEN